MTIALDVSKFQKPSAKPVENPSEPVWHKLDTNTLSGDAKSLYYEYRKAQDTANKARKAFEAEMIELASPPDTLTLAFGYKFGGLSVAYVPAKRPSTSKPAMSLEQLLARPR